MNHPFLPRRAALALCIALAAGTLSPSIAHASGAAEAVSFQPNNPWTQEIGSVSRNDYSREYSVSIGAGKTLQINLVTRNPNVYFQVRTANDSTPLVDTEKTGATTWSTQVAADTTYTVRVFIDPDVAQRGEVAKYALQIGQYGPKDMQPAMPAAPASPPSPSSSSASGSP